MKKVHSHESQKTHVGPHTHTAAESLNLSSDNKLWYFPRVNHNFIHNFTVLLLLKLTVIHCSAAR